MAAQLNFWRSIWTGYIFWTLFTSLPALIWFYPLNELRISGYETFVLILWSPIILNFASARRFFQSNFGDLILKILCLVGLISFRCPTTFRRLLFLTVGTGGSVLKFACDLLSTDEAERKFSFWGYTVGWMAVLCSRILYRSIMPAFNDDLTNLLIIFITVLNIMATIIKFPNTHVTLDYSTAKVDFEKVTNSKTNFILVGLGYGSLLYTMHGIFGETSTPCRWISGPFPDDVGPQPTPWCLCIFFALIFGLWLSTKRSFIFRKTWWAIGASGFFIMYKFYGYTGYLGAVLLAVFSASVWPAYTELVFRERHNRLGSTLALAMTAYVAEILYSVWTVAYNFVPGGYYTRETTLFLVILVTILLILGFRGHGKSRSIDLFYRFDTTQVSFGKIWRPLILFCIISSCGIFSRYHNWNSSLAASSNLSTDNFTAMVWTYHFGYDNKGWPSLQRSAELMENLRADVIGLLETDASRPYMGNNDLAQWLAETLGMYVDYGPNTRTHTWGTMLLSRFPILSSRHHLLPSPRGELAPAISAILNISNARVGVVVTHFGNDVDDEDRKLQALAIADITADFYRQKIPTVFLGYVTSKPYSRDYETLRAKGHLEDIDPSDGNRFCEYIFYSRLNRLAYARVSHGGLSDTEVQMGKFKIPANYNDEDYQDTYINGIQADRVPSEHRLPDVFGNFTAGHYIVGQHHYHMWTPKYFMP